MRDRDSESGDSKEMYSKRLNERDNEGYNGEDDYSRDFRLKGRNLEIFDKKVKE